jgi:C4-dicarboxylate-specific signal transduction histidine kinase
MGQIVTQSERAAAIVEHYRRLIRKRPPARVPSSVNALVVAALDLTRAEARQSGVAVRTDLDQSLPPVLCDEIEIEQALVNLIKNALEAMASVPREGHELAIRTGRGEGGRVLVSVRDTGPGPGEADLERLFEPFFTTRAGGLGMGLPISRSIIEAHGGRLWASRGPDGGAEFQFTLPADNGATAADNKPTLSGQR